MSNIISKIGKNTKLIEGNDEVRVQKCLQAVREICEQYDCMLVPTMTTQGNDMTGFRLHGDVIIVPIPMSREPKASEKKSEKS